MIGILLCTYNGETYLRQQLDSILAQDTGEDFRILVSDDGSTDGTRMLLREMSSAHPDRITLLPAHASTGSAWRHFLSLLAAGHGRDFDYLMLSDQDDVWKPEKLSRCLREMKAMEAAYGSDSPMLVHCDSEITDGDLRVLAPSFVTYQKMSPRRCKLQQLLVQNNVVGGAILMNRALAALVTEVPDHCVMHDQWLALLASAFGHIRFVPEALYYYRQHQDNVLGAAKGSRVREVLGRLGIGRKDGKNKAEMDAHSKQVYGDLFRQAECFMMLYSDRLSPQQKKMLCAFVSIPGKNRIGKILTILRYGFTYNLLHRTIGEFLFI